MPAGVTRLAPSPTGALHLGNARTFLINWLLARQSNWKIVLRIEDLDGPRVKSGADQQAMDDLRWLGIDWDEGPTYQSTRAIAYRRAIDELSAAGHTYPCVCSRKEIEQAASAPHASDGSSVYPGTCRGRFASTREAAELTGKPPAIRYDVPDRTIEFTDGFSGIHRFDLEKQLGDFVLLKNDGLASYQLAVVVDDLAAGVTHIVRGDDLLDSVPRQMLIYESLGQSHRMPQYFHLPLIIGPDGKRLAKRHGDTRLSTLRDQGWPASRVLQLLAGWSGIDTTGIHSAADLVGRLDLQRVPRGPIVFDVRSFV
jgi:glutamyl-tRNA synthetase